MNGWRFDWVDALPQEVYDILIEELQRPADDGDEDED
jgi:hypothetical protein